LKKKSGCLSVLTKGEGRFMKRWGRRAARKGGREEERGLNSTYSGGPIFHQSGKGAIAREESKVRLDKEREGGDSGRERGDADNLLPIMEKKRKRFATRWERNEEDEQRVERGDDRADRKKEGGILSQQSIYILKKKIEGGIAPGSQKRSHLSQ